MFFWRSKCCLKYNCSKLSSSMGLISIDACKLQNDPPNSDNYAHISMAIFNAELQICVFLLKSAFSRSAQGFLYFSDSIYCCVIFLNSIFRLS